MASKMFVVGTNSDQLSNYLREKGSFNIVGSSVSLAADRLNLESKAIIADKLIIILNDRNMDFKKEYLALRELTLGENIFRYTELYVFAREDDESLDNYAEMLEVLAEDIQARTAIPDVDIALIRDREEYSLEVIYNTIIGQTELTEMENAYTDRIRRPKGDSARFSYEPGDTHNVIIKPYSFEGIIQKGEIRRNSIVSDDKRTIAETSKERKEYPNVPKVNVRRQVKKDMMVIVGEENSGKSLLGTAISLAASVNDIKTLILDFKEESDYPRIFTNSFDNSVPIQILTLPDIVGKKGTTENPYRHSILAIDSILHLSYVLDRIEELPFDSVILEMSREDLKKYYNEIKRYTSLTIFTCRNIEDDVISIKPYVDLVDKALISMTNYFPKASYDKTVDARAVKGLLGMDVNVMTPLRLKDLDVPLELYRLIRGVI